MNTNCDCKPKCCNTCKKCPSPCGCPLRVLSIQAVPEKPGVMKFNLDGHTQFFDFSDIVAATETDTFLRVDSVGRQLRYLAENHTNNISARQLGSILHLADIGDVNTGDVTQNSMLVYQKNSECGKGCGTISNQWTAFSAIDNYEDTAETFLSFEKDGAPRTIAPPAHTNQYYQLSWRAGDRLGYTQPVEVAAPAVDANGFSQLLFVNPTTRQLETLKVKVSIDVSGEVTFKTHD